MGKNRTDEPLNKNRVKQASRKERGGKKGRGVSIISDSSVLQHDYRGRLEQKEELRQFYMWGVGPKERDTGRSLKAGRYNRQD